MPRALTLRDAHALAKERHAGQKDRQGRNYYTESRRAEQRLRQSQSPSLWITTRRNA